MTSPGGSESKDDGKITMAVLGVQLNTLIQQNTQFILRFDNHLEQAGARDRQLAVQSEQINRICETLTNHNREIKELDDRIDEVNVKATWWNGINSALVAIAGALGFYGK